MYSVASLASDNAVVFGVTFGGEMARNLQGESEFGLPDVMPVLRPDGTVAEGADVAAAVAAGGLPALTDATAVKDGAVGQQAGPVGSLQQLGHELRVIYASDPGEGTDKVANPEFTP